MTALTHPTETVVEDSVPTAVGKTLTTGISVSCIAFAMPKHRTKQKSTDNLGRAVANLKECDAPAISAISRAQRSDDNTICSPSAAVTVDGATMNTADSSANKASAEQLISMSVNSESAAPAQPAGSNWNGVNPCQGNPWNEVGRGLRLVLFPMLPVGRPVVCVDCLRNDGD